MRRIVIAMVFVLFVSWVVFPSLGFSKADFVKGEPCKTCHEGAPVKDGKLTKVGECYKGQATKDLSKCKADNK